MKLTVQKSSKKSDPKSVDFEVSDGTTVEQLKDDIAKAFRVPPNSQGLKFANPTWKEGDKKRDQFIRLNSLLETIGELKAKGLSSKTTIELKNNGAQVPYRWFFFTEYFGPMPIMAFFAMRPDFIYGAGASKVPLAFATQVAVVAYILHFVKRELETLFVHRFSKPSAPLNVVARNSAYYWGFAALVAYFVCHPAASTVPDQLVTLTAGGMAVMELGNFAVHLWFAAQRKGDKDAKRPIPAGSLFFVSCPNYFFEVAAWVFFCVLVNNHPAAWAFTIAGGVQMAIWAKERHVLYVAQEKAEGSPRRVARARSAMIPFIW